MKICNRCKVDKPLTEFHKNKNSKDGLNNRCGRCTVEYNNKRSRENRELFNEYYRKSWAKTNGRLRQYNLTVEEYQDMLNKQGNSCAICKKALVKEYVDHCHKTGKVRGVLCLKCNTGIGLLEDSIDILDSAILYLRASLV